MDLLFRMNGDPLEQINNDILSGGLGGLLASQAMPEERGCVQFSAHCPSREGTAERASDCTKLVIIS